MEENGNGWLGIIPYVFLVTVVPQIVVLFVIASTFGLAYFAVKHNVFLMWMFAAAGFLGMLFAFISVSVFVASYGVSPFVIHSNFQREDRYEKRITWREGNLKNPLTGRRPIYAQSVEVKMMGGTLAGMTINSLWVGATGVFSFLLEFVWICLSDRRAESWVNQKQYLLDKIEEEEGGRWHFFKVPILSLVTIIVSWIVVFFCILYANAARNPTEDLQFSITHKKNWENNHLRIQIEYSGQLYNAGPTWEQIEGTVYYRDKDGNLIMEDSLTLGYNSFCLEEGATCEISLSVRTPPSDVAGQTLWDLDIDDVEITMDINNIRYDNDKIVYFPDDDLVLIKALNN